ncbi:MAG: hypothetical protein FJ254_04620 [Phycisphaerae bacterium]|nr:hypothetical protein [Phycisphaerae bacterium]
MNRRAECNRHQIKRASFVHRARLALITAMSSVLLSSTNAVPRVAALDPAASWRELLATAGCPPGVAHDLAVRIERLAGPPPARAQPGAVTAEQRAEQITHLAVGRHGLQLTPAQLDAALAALFSPAESGDHGADTGGGPSAAHIHARTSVPAEPGRPFTTRLALELLREWLPTPAQR